MIKDVVSETMTFFKFREKILRTNNDKNSFYKLFDELESKNQSGLNYNYRIKDELHCTISPKMIIGGFDKVEISLELRSDHIIAQAQVNFTLKWILVATIVAFIGFIYGAFCEDIPIWILPLIIIIPLWFQFAVKIQQKRLMNLFGKDIFD